MKTKNMKSRHLIKWRQTLLQTLLVAGLATTMGATSGVLAAPQIHNSYHTFTMHDLIGDYEGTTFAETLGNTTGTGNGGDPAIVCGLPLAGSPDCDVDHPPKLGNEATTLYPIDSTFGFEVVPYTFAVDKERGDGVWGEGYIGNIFDPLDPGKVIGIETSNAATETFVVPAGLGTWCTGLGGNSVKCSTEHFVTMERVLTCHETIPSYYADPLTGIQKLIEDPANPGVTAVDCADTKLDNNLIINNTDCEIAGCDPLAINDKPLGTFKYDPTDGTLINMVDWPAIADWGDPDDVLTFLEPNESTVLDDIAFGASYSMTAKDDGKPLYRWGNLIKRPNDIRLYARFGLPSLWFSPATKALNDGNGLRITSARLFVVHTVTNNPNDQLRPEDMENEAAIGRQPGYDIVNTYGTDSWVSDTSCYEGDGTEIPAGTVLKNTAFKLEATDPLTHVWDNDPYVWSKDLREGYTNAWYTTVDREPFEWSYDTDGDGAADESYRRFLPEPLPAGTTLLTGPRWRFTPTKFGQDLPAIEIPVVNCAPPPYQKAMIKYDVGELASTANPSGPGPTIINILDWTGEDERSVIDPDSGLPVSPLTFTNGWVTNGTYNEGTVVNPDVTVVNPFIKAVTTNGLPVTQAFDLSLYVKGDQKPAALYNARLYLEWDDGK